jgi:hypothetical protein
MRAVGKVGKVNTNNDKPTLQIAAAINALLECNETTRGAVAGDMYLGQDFFLVALRRPRVIEGELVNTADNELDIATLINTWRAQHGGQ